MVAVFITFITFITCLITLPVLADDIPDPKVWWETLPDDSAKDPPALIRNLTIKSNQPDKAKRWDKIMTDFSDLGFLNYIPTESVDFVRRLNPEQNLSDVPDELLFDSELLQLILVDRGSRMSALGRSKGRLRPLAHWSMNTADRKTSASMLDWLSRNLGYDAVVIDARDGLILAGLIKSSTELGQGLLVKDSSKKWIIKESNTRGEALLQMLKTSGSLAVFEVLLAKGETLSVSKGSKILLGQNTNWMRMIQPGPKASKPVRFQDQASEPP